MRAFVIFLFTCTSLSLVAAPMELVSGELESGQIFLPCEFDGNQQSCLLDTGAVDTYIKKDDFSNQYKPFKQVKVGGASGTTNECDVIEFDRFNIGQEFIQKNMQTLRCPTGDAKLEGDPAIANRSLIGLNIFEESRIYFDFTNLDISSIEEIPPNSQTQDIQREPNGHFSLPMVSGTQQTYGLWDTGAGLTSLDREFVKKNPGNFTFVQDISGHDGSGITMKMELYQAKEIWIGEHKFENEYVIAFSFEPLRPHFNENVDYIIGYNLITKANWYFDFVKDTWAAE